MPFTPYHFGPSVFVGLTLRKWLDVPVFVLANVIVDLEVLLARYLGHGWTVHEYFHTLLIGAAVGVFWGIAAYPLRHFFEKMMRILLIPYRTGFWKMVVSGVLGVWLHAVIDAIYHWDVRIFWPSKAKPLWRLLSQEQVEIVCIGFLIAAAVIYAFTAVSYLKKKKQMQNSV
ncbi:MAG: hypothetical protein PHQ35_06620 [Phycisphaerae bacterium]|nr:hypothetical protein [Phycisphaerae bacterium]MDD5381148.1 hypothetical protein [Phycisphaerae bacterium]